VSHPESARVLPALPDWLGEGFPAQGSWTYEDYCRIPDDGKRYEVIRGVLHVSPSPGARHQRVLMHLLWELHRYVASKGLGEVLVSPFDVQLPGLATPIEPDIIYVSRERAPIVKEPYILGPPDLVVEVLSPSNTRQYLRTRLEVFAEGGIEECWVVDPDARRIDVHVREGTLYRLHGSFGADDTARSKVLGGFEVPVASVCPDAPESGR